MVLGVIGGAIAGAVCGFAVSYIMASKFYDKIYDLNVRYREQLLKLADGTIRQAMSRLGR